ncbi:YihY/virulence factor BrkB family protein [Myxococcus landrumensis]|uniref:YihY/virulence factor BrkB family protein n=1 Tax=Myxococcus landrumensis TaxID=2813577 RepID=A0ABX7N3N5_9BACT|nr:YihY/virulence factor BrkB family protein [Myxococcus landrumus]QSQ13349.1 YihY/virulence factor BrkB family protein [Myxococcus landrumus]
MRLPRLKDLTWREFIRRFVKELQEDTVTDLAAQLSYYLLFSLFPFLFFLVTLVAYLPFAPGAVDAMLDRLRPLVPTQALDVVTQHLTSLVSQQQPKLLTVGLLVALWSASRGVDALRKALNLAYDVPESRPLWRTEGLAVFLTLVGTLLIPLSFAVFLLGGRLGEWLAARMHVQEAFHVVWSWVRWPFTAALVMLVLSLCYYLLPDVKHRFRYFTPGSVIGTLAWMASTWGFTQYVEHFGKYNVTYGSIGGVVVLMLWLYISGLVFILGGELNAVLAHAKGEVMAKEAGALPVPAHHVTPGAAKRGEAPRSRLAFWRWRRRSPRGTSSEPPESEHGRPPSSSLH